MSWLWGSTTNTQYEELVEKACSPLKLAYPQGEDIALNLEITDMIRSKAVQPKPAMQSLKRRVGSANGRVQMYALSLVDTCIKNGGDHFLAEIASKEFIDEMTSVIKAPGTNAEVRQMALRMFQTWALAFESKRELIFFVDAYHDMKNSGIKFPPPPVQNTSSLIETTTAPAWVDSDVCMRCRSAFTFTNRKHHCRNCGLVFDQACSSRAMALPKFGIKEEVRVCESCWVKAGRNKPAPAVPGRTPRTRQDYDADLQRAIELSLQSQSGMVPSEPPLALKTGALDDEDEQLRLAIEASLRDMERARPSAPTIEDDAALKPLPTFDLNPQENGMILTFTNTLDQMAAYGERDLRRFPHVQLLHDQAMAVGGKLQRNAEEKSTKAQMLTEMQGKLGEAVALYGRILDGQQAYAQRKAQEAQHAQYYAQPPQQYYQPPHGYYVPQAPYANGYAAPPQTAPPQAQPPQAQAQAPHTASMYPSMPTYAQPQYAQPQWAPPPAQAQPQPQQQPQPQPQQPPQHQPPSRQTSYVPDPQLPSAPPPVDLASHPSLSPRSTTTALPSPSRQASYASPTAAAVAVPSAPARSPSYSSAMTAMSPVEAPPAALANPWESAPSAPPQSPQHAPQQQQSPHQQFSALQPQPQQEQQQPQPLPQAQQQPPQQQPQQPQHYQQPPQPQQQQQQQQQQQKQPNGEGWYTASMFPSAPGVAPFPSAPQEAPAAAKPAQVEEALLIEL